MTQEQLAFACDVHPTEISRLERNGRDSTMYDDVAFARAQNIGKRSW